MEDVVKKTVTAKILSVKDRKMRTFLLGESLAELLPAGLTGFLETLLDEANRNIQPSKELLVSFVDLLERIFQLEIEKKIISLLHKAEISDKSLMLFIKPPHPHKFIKKGEVPVSDLMMDYLSLGVKRSFAKKMDRNLLRRMVFEKDPVVIKHLLSNPLVTEKDVLKIASIRPTTTEALKTIYASEKWVNCYNVKEALVKNPYSPFRIALLMLSYMQKKELETIKDDITLHPELRGEAKRMLIRRGL